MIIKNSKFAITTKSGRSVVMEFTTYAEAIKYAEKHFGKGCIVQLLNTAKSKSSNPIVQNAMSAKEAKELADLLKMKPWEDPKYKAEVTDALDKDVRRILGEKKVEELKKILKARGLWRD